MFGCFQNECYSTISGREGPLLTQMNGTCLGTTRVIRTEDECMAKEVLSLLA